MMQDISVQERGTRSNLGTRMLDCDRSITGVASSQFTMARRIDVKKLFGELVDSLLDLWSRSVRLD